MASSETAGAVAIAAENEKLRGQLEAMRLDQTQGHGSFDAQKAQMDRIRAEYEFKINQAKDAAAESEKRYLAVV